jgi:hypothetical protein
VLRERAAALGRLFERARSRTETLRILAAGARRVAGRRAGVSAALAPEEFARRLRASSAPRARDLAVAIVAADAASPRSDAEMTRLASGLAAARRRYIDGR